MRFEIVVWKSIDRKQGLWQRAGAHIEADSVAAARAGLAAALRRLGWDNDGRTYSIATSARNLHKPKRKKKAKAAKASKPRKAKRKKPAGKKKAKAKRA